MLQKIIIACLGLVPIAAMAQNVLKLNPGATLSCTGGVKITLQNTDLINDGAITASATSRFIFNGNGNNQISGTTVSTFDELEIAKTGSGLLSLQQTIRATGKIVFTSNFIDLNGHNISLGTTGFLEGESETSRITSSSGGVVFLSVNLNAPSAVDPGNLGAIITSAQNLGNTVINRGHQSQVNSGGTGSSILRYYDITPTNNTGLNATLRINYLDAEKNLLNENEFQLYKSDDNVHWTNIGFSARDAALDYAEQTGISSFSRWTLSTIASALPVTGLKLSGQWKNNMSYLEWETLTEHNNSHFNIERKYNDELNFLHIGRKNSNNPDGNSDLPTKYYWTDAANSNRGVIQYRLQQQDLDGRSAYSNIISIQPNTSSSFIQKLFPSFGVRGSLYLQVGNMRIDKMQVQVFDMGGRQILNKQVGYASQWVALPPMASGVYKLIVRSGDQHWEGSFVKE